MEEKKKQERRQRAKNGEHSSKMMSFRCDWDVLNILSEVSNKGRLINQLVRDWERDQRDKSLDRKIKRQTRERDPWETPPEVNDLAEIMP